MFENLVESGSHSEDVKRKGSFMLGFTMAIYLRDHRRRRRSQEL